MLGGGSMGERRLWHGQEPVVVLAKAWAWAEREGFVSLPPSMRSRCARRSALEKLSQNGGSPECEAAVSASLEWLKGKQKRRWLVGPWQQSRHDRPRFALLPWAAARRPDSPFYGDNVMKGIMYLIEARQEEPPRHHLRDWKGEKAARALTSTASRLTRSARCTPWPVWDPNPFPACVRPLKRA
jgi:hypothetical protein